METMKRNVFVLPLCVLFFTNILVAVNARDIDALTDRCMNRVRNHDPNACTYLLLDDRSLNIDTFEARYVLMGYALPEEAQPNAIHRTGTARTRIYSQVSNRGETAHRKGGVTVGFAFGTE